MFPHMSYECFRHTVDSLTDTGLLYIHSSFSARKFASVGFSCFNCGCENLCVFNLHVTLSFWSVTCVFVIQNPVTLSLWTRM